MEIRNFLLCCWVLLEPTFIASAVVATMRMRRQGHVAHGTSPLYTSVRSLRDLHSLGPSALGCVNSVETCTSVYNLYIHTFTRCSLDKPPSCSQRFTTLPVVELSCQFRPSNLGGVLDVVLYSPLPEVSRSRGFLSYLVPYGVRHSQNVISQSIIIVNCGSDHGDVLTGEAVV